MLPLELKAITNINGLYIQSQLIMPLKGRKSALGWFQIKILETVLRSSEAHKLG